VDLEGADGRVFLLTEVVEEEPPEGLIVESAEAEGPRAALDVPFDVVQAAEDVFAAQDPGRIADILVGFARHVLDRIVLFDTRNQSEIRIWSAYPAGINARSHEFQATVRELPLLKVALQSHAPFLGPAPESPMYGYFFDRLSIDTPERVLLVPIRALGDVTCVLYGDSQREITEDEVIDLQLLAKEASTALDILLSEAG
jgi:hypothetical protein